MIIFAPSSLLVQAPTWTLLSIILLNYRNLYSLAVTVGSSVHSIEYTGNRQLGAGMYLKNAWYVAATAEELGRNLLGRWICEEPLVM
jgi:hypothetical protein